MLKYKVYIYLHFYNEEMNKQKMFIVINEITYYNKNG